MNEATVVRMIIANLKKGFPRAVIYKHADIYTAGIPDISITCGKITHWIEVKFLKPVETQSTMSKHFDRLQLANMRLLEREGHAFYLIAKQRRAVGTGLGLWLPSMIADILEYPHPETTLTPAATFTDTMEYVAQIIRMNIDPIYGKEN